VVNARPVHSWTPGSVADATMARPEKRVDSVISASMPGMPITVSVRTRYGQIDTIATPRVASDRAASVVIRSSSR